MTTLSTQVLATRFGQAYYQDTFNRASTTGSTTIGSANGWGTDTDGDTWSGFSVYTSSINASHQGQVTNSSSQAIATLGSKTIGDGVTRVKISCSSTSDSAGLILRSASLSNQYRVRYNNGNFVINLVLSGSTTSLATITYTLTAGTVYVIEAWAVGSQIWGKIWQDGQPESGATLLTATDTNFTSGSSGLFVKGATTSSVITFSNFVVTDGWAINRDATTRFRLMAQTTPNTSMRVGIAIQQIRSLPFRIMMAAQKQRNIFTRLLMQSYTTQDIATRFLLALYSILNKNVVVRTLLRAFRQRNIGGRLRIWVMSQDDLPLRVLVNALRTRNIFSRFRLYTLVLHDLNQRVRIDSQSVWSVSLRFMLQLYPTRGFMTRTRLQVITLRDLVQRVRLALLSQHDLGLRFRLNKLHARNIFTRFQLHLPNLSDLLTRLILLPGHQWDLTTRFNLKPQQLLDFWARVQLLAIQQGANVAGRLLVQSLRTRNIFTRLTLYPTYARDIWSRLRLITPVFTLVRTLPFRFRLVPPPLLNTSQATSWGTTYAGNGVLPLAFSARFPYMVGGIPLDSQPSFCTTPLTVAGNVLVAGSTFILIFNGASSMTQSLLTDGSIVTLTFQTATGIPATGLVQLQSMLVGTQFQVRVTTLVPITLTTRVIQTPFF